MTQTSFFSWGAPALAASAWLAVAPMTASAAADYPTRAITLTVPFTTSGQFDLIARLISTPLSKELGQTIIVDNVGGAGGNIGGLKVARSAPDGYNLVQYGGNYPIAKYLNKNLNYDPIGDFEPIAGISLSPHVLLINKDLPVKDFKEFVAYAKAQGGKLNYASPGVGSSMHLAFEEVRAHFDFPIEHVPYKGGSNAMNDLAGGQVQAGIVAVAAALPFIQSGQIRPIAITGAQRAVSLPDVPTVAELGYEGYSNGSWAALAAPKGTPPAVIERLNAAMQKVLKDPAISERLEGLSFTTLPGTPEDLRKLIESEMRRYSALIERLGLAQ